MPKHIIHLAEHSRRHNMPMVVRPTKDNRVERVDQLNLRRCRVRTQNGTRFHQERMRILTGRCYQKLSAVPSNMLPKKIKPIIDMRDTGLVRRELKPSFSQEMLDQWSDLILQHLVRVAGNNEVVGIPYQANFGVVLGPPPTPVL